MHKLSFITDLSHLGLLKVSGQRAKELLQGQLTCDLNEVDHTSARLGAHCNPQGRIISLFRIFAQHSDYYLLMPRDMISIALNALKKYAVFFKVELSDVTHEFAPIGYSGVPLQNISQTIIQLDSRFILLSDQNLWETLKQIHQAISIDEWKYQDIKALTPQIYPETSGKFLPHEINLPALHGVSFNKGCYTGQEIIARMQYRGKLKTRLFRASMSCPTRPIYGSDIYDNLGNAAGTLVDFCEKGYNNYEILFISQATEKLFIDPLKQYPLEINP